MSHSMVRKKNFRILQENKIAEENFLRNATDLIDCKLPTDLVCYQHHDSRQNILPNDPAIYEMHGGDS